MHSDFYDYVGNPKLPLRRTLIHVVYYYLRIYIEYMKRVENWTGPPVRIMEREIEVTADFNTPKGTDTHHLRRIYNCNPIHKTTPCKINNYTAIRSINFSHTNKILNEILINTFTNRCICIIILN